MSLISVIITTHNNEAFIAAAIQSVLAQQGGDAEIVVVDDASTDGTEQAVLSLGAPQVRYHRLPCNHGGPSRPRNVGLDLARGEYVAFLDADDLMLPGRLEHSARFLDACPEAALVFADAVKFDGATGENLGRLLQGYAVFHALPRREVVGGGQRLPAAAVFRALFQEQFIFPSGVTARKSALVAVGGFDESLTNGDDLDLWFRLTRIHPVGFLPQPLFRYRIWPGSISHSAPIRGARLYENRIRSVQKQLDAGVPRDVLAPARQLLAKYYDHLGFFYRTQAQMDKARACFGKALRRHFSFCYVRGYLLSLCRVPSRAARRRVS